MARIDIATILDNQDKMFSDLQGIFGDTLTTDPRSATYMLLFPIAALMRAKNEEIQTLADKMNIFKCMGTDLDDILNGNVSFTRKQGSYAQVQLLLKGGVGVELKVGDLIVEAKDGIKYILDEDKILNTQGYFTFKCEVQGSIGNKPSGDIVKFVKLMSGVYELVHDNDSAGGQDVETDNEYLARWFLSRKDGYWNLDGIVTEVLKLQGVKSVYADKNYEMTVQNGLPPKSIVVVVDGGLDTEIANAIWLKKDPAIQSIGDTEIEVLDIQGMKRKVHFYRPKPIKIDYQINYTDIDGIVDLDTLKNLVETYLDNLSISSYVTSYDCEQNFIRSVYNHTKLLDIEILFKRESESTFNRVIKLNYDEVSEHGDYTI